MFERDKLKRAAIINNSDAHRTEYKIARNNVNANIRKAKTNYYKRYFETNLGDIKKSLKGVNSILGRKLPTTEINRIDVGNDSSTTPLEISNALNYHFTHIGTRLADNIPKTSVCFEDYITPSDSSFTLSKTHCGVVHRLVSSPRVYTATGLDGISARLLKEASPEIVPSLTHIINLSIRCGCFPDEWEISRVLYFICGGY